MRTTSLSSFVEAALRVLREARLDVRRGAERAVRELGRQRALARIELRIALEGRVEHRRREAFSRCTRSKT